MPQKGDVPLGQRDEKIREALKNVLGMSVPKYIAVSYGRSQKAAQIMFNQPDTRTEKDEQLLEQISEEVSDSEALLTQFISRILGSDQRVLKNIQATIDSKFQLIEAGNTIRSLSRPMLSEIPEINQIEMINDKYFYAALDMQAAWAKAKHKQKKSKAAVRIPYTHEQIRSAFQTVIDMCRLVIELKIADESKGGRETKARAYVLLGAAAIQMGRYDIVEENMAQWRDRFELSQDPAIPMRVRNLLMQKELWLKKRKGEYANGLEIAETQWRLCESEKESLRWMQIEPLACVGLELAVLNVNPDKPTPDEITTLSTWLQRFDLAPDRTEEIGQYLQEDPELLSLRELSTHSQLNSQWSKLMKKFGVLVLAFIVAATAFGFTFDFSPVVSAASEALLSAPFDHTFAGEIQAGANPGKIIFDLLRMVLGM